MFFVLPRPHPAGRPATLSRPGRGERGSLPRISFFSLFITLTALLLTGCVDHGGANFAIHSVIQPNTSLRANFTQGIYRFDDKNTMTILLLDGPIENPTQAVTIRLMWAPHAGKTPSGRTATNATIHYVIFAGSAHQEVGLYSGAGFVYPESKPGADTLKAGMWEASLRLTDKTPGFDDRLGQALGNGGLHARRDDGGVDENIRRLDVLVRQKLGYPRMVEGGNENPKSDPGAPGADFGFRIFFLHLIFNPPLAQ